MRTFFKLNKAIPAAVAIVAAAAIFLAYSQFNISDLADTGNAGEQDFPDRDNVQINQNDNNNNNSNNNTAEASVTREKLALPDLFERTQRSVVQVSATSDPAGLGSLGTGFVFDDRGHIVTNNHVVLPGEGDLAVTFYDGTVYSATLIGSDPFTDLAVLYVDDVPEEKLASLPLANSTTVRVGEQVAAIGNPFGLSSSMTAGIVSGVGRTIPTQNAGVLQFLIPDVIQTDAPVNPGNSGGPLLSTWGEVVGINTAIQSATGEFSGIGFAVSSNTVAKIVPALIDTGSFEHPWVGISSTEMTPGIAEVLNLEEPRGVLVVEVVPGGPAEKAGIQGGDNPTRIGGQTIPLGGDIILELDGNEIRTLDDILVYLQREKSVGDTMDVTVLRDGNEMVIELLLEARPSAQDLL